jgi:hypothetical protein
MRPRIAFKTQETATRRPSAIGFDFVNFVGHEAENRGTDNAIDLLAFRAPMVLPARMCRLSHHNRNQFNRRYSLSTMQMLSEQIAA